jgi:Fe-S oxidoreductase
MPAHKKMARNIADVHNQFGLPHKNRKKWIAKGINVAEKADVLYFAGCSASYTNNEIAQATGKILNAAGTPFMVMTDEWCCGNVPYSVGMIDEATEIAKRNIEAVKASGAKTLLTSCAECYRMWKVDYPKMLDIATADLDFEVIHLLDFADKAIANGSLKPTRNVNLRLTYHDACSVSRLCDAWRPWKGERGWMGTIEPRYKRRRGTEGLYSQPRNILDAIPGLTIVEMPRIRENAFCCGAGRGTKEAFPELARFSANQRLEEVREVGAEALVSACPFCKNNFSQTAKANGEELKVMDIAEVVLASL